MGIHKLPEVDDGFRMEPDPMFGPKVGVIRRDFKPPLPVGSYVACVFRITGYDPDCDGGAMARLEQVDRNGSTTGWEQDALGIYPECEVVVDGPSDLHWLADNPPLSEDAIERASAAIAKKIHWINDPERAKELALAVLRAAYRPNPQEDHNEAHEAHSTEG